MSRLIFPNWFPLLLLVISSCAILRQEKQQGINSNDIVRWSDTTKLSWDDFRGETIERSALISEILVQSPASFRKSTWFMPLTFAVECYMDKKGSWVDKSAINAQLLLYNQTIFDLHELYARRLRKKLAETDFSVGDPTPAFSEIYQRNSYELTQATSRYRAETGMGRNSQKIKEWSEKIWAELRALDDFRAK